MQRFFVAPEEMAGEDIALPAEVLHHLGTVLRRGTGEEILLLDGRGSICLCRVTSLGRRGGSARVLERWEERESVFPITLLQGLPKGDKFDLVLQKGTELGLTHFVPILCARSVPSLPPGREETRMARWEKIVREAARQSRRPCLPEVTPPLLLGTALAQRTEELRLLLWEEESRPLEECLPPAAPRDAVILVGPEGGLGVEEAELARRAGFLPVSLGSRILRTETTGLVVASILQFLYGDLGAARKGEPQSRQGSAPRKENS